MSNKEKLVSIVIGHYLLVKCLTESVNAIMKNTTYKNFELIIADDGTNTIENDQGLINLKNKFNLKLVLNSKNNSYSYNINEGVKLARGEYLVLLSNDVWPLELGWVTKMVNFMETHPDCGAMSPRSVDLNGKNYFVGTEMKDGFAKHISYGEITCPETSETDTVNGACIIVRKIIFDAIGGFDERFTGLGFEDVDFSFAVKDKGYKLFYYSGITLLHLVEKVTKALNRDDYLKDNHKIFLEKWGFKNDKTHRSFL